MPFDIRMYAITPLPQGSERCACHCNHSQPHHWPQHDCAPNIFAFQSLVRTIKAPPPSDESLSSRDASNRVAVCSLHVRRDSFTLSLRVIEQVGRSQIAELAPTASSRASCASPRDQHLHSCRSAASALALTQFSKVVVLDNDMTALQMTTSRSRAETPGMVFHTATVAAQGTLRPNRRSLRATPSLDEYHVSLRHLYALNYPVKPHPGMSGRRCYDGSDQSFGGAFTDHFLSCRYGISTQGST